MSVVCVCVFVGIRMKFDLLITGILVKLTAYFLSRYSYRNLSFYLSLIKTIMYFFLEIPPER